MKKQLWATLFATVSILLLCTVAGAADVTCAHGYTAWDATASLPADAGKYYLTADVTLPESWKVDTDITLCLCGNNIDIDKMCDTIQVGDCTLTITDCTDNPGSITCNDNDSWGVTVRLLGTAANNCNFVLLNGTLTQKVGDSHLIDIDEVDDLYEGHTYNKIPTPDYFNEDRYYTHGNVILYGGALEPHDRPSGWGESIHGSYLNVKFGGAWRDDTTTFLPNEDDPFYWGENLINMLKPSEYEDPKFSPYLRAVPHEHCICGDTACTETDAVHTPVTFLPWTETDTMPLSGNWYLTTDVDLKNAGSSWKPADDLVLCLGGHTITSAYENLLSTDTADVAITDCAAASGTLTSKWDTVCVGDGSFTLYAGHLVSQEGAAVGVIEGNTGAVTLYGGALSGTPSIVDNRTDPKLTLLRSWYGTNDNGETLGQVTDYATATEYKKICYSLHEHIWTYTSEALPHDTLGHRYTATCTTGCPYAGNDLTMDLLMPTIIMEDWEEDASASFAGAGEGVTTFVGKDFPTISYYGNDNGNYVPLSEAPTTAGQYQVVFQLGGKDFRHNYTIREHTHQWAVQYDWTPGVPTSMTVYCPGTCTPTETDLYLRILPPATANAGDKASAVPTLVDKAGNVATTLAGLHFESTITYVDFANNTSLPEAPTQAGRYRATAAIYWNGEHRYLYVDYTIDDHVHHWSLGRTTNTDTEQTLTATCLNNHCSYGVVSLTLTIPELRNEGEPQSPEAGLSGTLLDCDAFTVHPPRYSVYYGESLTEAPVLAGRYMVIVDVYVGSNCVFQLYLAYEIGPRLEVFYDITLTNDYGATTTISTNDRGVIAFLPTPTSPDPWHLFQGWFDENGSRVTVGTALTADITLSARWSLEKTAVFPDWHVLSFRTGRGNKLSQVTVRDGAPISLAAFVPEREGYTFTGWYLDSALTKPVTELTLRRNTAVYAGWTETTELPPIEEAEQTAE